MKAVIKKLLGYPWVVCKRVGMKVGLLFKLTFKGIQAVDELANLLLTEASSWAMPRFQAAQRWIAHRIDDAMSIPGISGPLRVYLWIVANLVTIYATTCLTVIAIGILMATQSLAHNPQVFLRSLIEARANCTEVVWLDVVLSIVIILAFGGLMVCTGILAIVLVAELGRIAHGPVLPVKICLDRLFDVDLITDFPWLASALTVIILVFRPEGLYQVFCKAFIIREVFLFTLANFGVTLFVWCVSYCCHTQIQHIEYHVIIDDYLTRAEFFQAGKEAKDRSEWPVQLSRCYLKSHHKIWEHYSECRSCVAESENSAAPASAPANEQETPNEMASLSPSKTQPKSTSSTTKPSGTPRKFVTFDLKNGN